MLGFSLEKQALPDFLKRKELQKTLVLWGGWSSVSNKDDLRGREQPPPGIALAQHYPAAHTPQRGSSDTSIRNQENKASPDIPNGLTHPRPPCPFLWKTLPRTRRFEVALGTFPRR